MTVCQSLASALAPGARQLWDPQRGGAVAQELVRGEGGDGGRGHFLWVLDVAIPGQAQEGTPASLRGPGS